MGQNNWVSSREKYTKMEFLINPNIGYLSIVGVVLFVMLTFVMPRSEIPTFGDVIRLALAWYEISQL